MKHTMTRTSLRTVLLLASIFLTFPYVGAAAAEDGPRSREGGAILTITGKVANTNRGPLDPTADLFFIHHNLGIDRAMQFSREKLASLPQHEVHADVQKLGKSTYAGPLLRDVLKEAGVTATTLRIVALDGYGADFPVAEIDNKGWILALARNGKPLGLGDLGPVWLVREQSAGESSDVAEQEHWVWAAFYIEAQ
jgi:hypothetical protein